MSELGTIRERVTRASEFFEKREAVVLTTFNLNGEFLENQALPVVFGVESSSAAAREACLHQELAETDCAVFYDPTVAPRISGKYRYTARPVPLKGRLFHPKLIIIAGKCKEGTTWVYLAVSSANLSLSGWGRNAESFGETWIHTRRQNAWQQLDDFLAWLQGLEPSGSELSNKDAVVSVRDALIQMPDSNRFRDDRNQPWSGTLYANFYTSVVHTDGFASFFKGGRTSRPHVLWVCSPYWGSVEKLVDEFDAKETVLVPAFTADRRKLGLSGDLEALNEIATVMRNDDEKKEKDARFWHMKTYWIDYANDITKTAVGSCNFTEAGLAGRNGNVEAMLVFDLEEAFPNLSVVKCKDELSDCPFNEEDVPSPVPVGIAVAYDWRSKCWRWFLESGTSQSDFRLKLPGLENLSIKPGTNSRSCDKPPSRGSKFKISYIEDSKEETWEGQIFEINLEHSQRTYGRSLTATEHLESWRTRVSPQGDKSNDDDGDNDYGHGNGGGNDGGTKGPIELASFGTVNLYDLYRAIRELRKQLQELEANTQAQYALLVTRPDSVMSLARLAFQDKETRVVGYLVLRELASVVADFAEGLLDKDQIKEMRKMLREVKKTTLNQLTAELKGDVGKAKKMLRWFEKRLAEMRG